MRPETITRQGKKFVLLAEQDFQKLLQDAEMLADVRAYDAAKARIERGEDEIIPISITTRRMAGENRVKIWREYRGLTQEQLAQASGVSRGMIAAMEAGHKSGSTATLKKLAGSLRIQIDDLA